MLGSLSGHKSSLHAALPPRHAARQPRGATIKPKVVLCRSSSSARELWGALHACLSYCACQGTAVQTLAHSDPHAGYPSTHVQTIELDSFRLMHRASFSHRNMCTYIVIVYVPGSTRCAAIENEVRAHPQALPHLLRMCVPVMPKQPALWNVPPGGADCHWPVT